ncbi:LytR/AlgR family response regulator transcription factor [Niastella populi]|uniref:DNA-binding response regulator n=1 Tax=Niastella populi TaxID=550983 RepID=A0A1V9GDH2_9BACT|nr:LytTR family DNA-binding domain-containing protein [Niastella populi]OQP68624.1 DNA-binding response regulator [Niastella populi]
MNIAIIEDEQLTAEDLAGLIGSIDNDIRVVALLDSVKNATAFLQQAPAVDLIFSDIQLGDGLSFEIFRTVPIHAPVIFCTAYDEYALDAIKSNGIEYILKPYTGQGIDEAIGRYRRLKDHFSAGPDYEKIIQAITGHKTPDKKASSILVYHRDKILPVGLNEAAVFYIDNELTHVQCFDNRDFVLNQSLDELEELCGSTFFRINRQHLVNRRAIQDANHIRHRKYIVNLSVRFKETLVVSKNRTANFLAWLIK